MATMDSKPPVGLLDSVTAHPLVWIVFSIIFLWLANYLIRIVLRYSIRKIVSGQEGTNTKKPDERFNIIYRDVVRAGAWTGILERTIVLLLVLLGEFSAVAWVMAAKGFMLQAFAGLRKNSGDHDPNAAITLETYLIGTFASFALAIIGGLLMDNLLGDASIRIRR